MEDAEGLRLQTLGLEAKRNCDVLLAKQYFKKSRTARSLYELGIGHSEGILGCKPNGIKGQQYFQEGWGRHGCPLCLTMLRHVDDTFKRTFVLDSNHNYAKYCVTNDLSWLNKAALVDRFTRAMVIYVMKNVMMLGGTPGSHCYNLMVEAANAGDPQAISCLVVSAISFDVSLYWLQRAVKQNQDLSACDRLNAGHSRPCYNDLRFVDAFALSWSKTKTTAPDHMRTMLGWGKLTNAHKYLIGKYDVEDQDQCKDIYIQTRQRVQQAVVCFVGILKLKGIPKDMRIMLGKVIWSTRETEWF